MTQRPPRLASLALVAAAAAAGASAQTVYRCGNAYSSVPCPDARAVDTRDPTTPEQRAESARLAAMQQRTGDAMARERLRKEAAFRPAAPASLGPAPPPPSASAAANLKPKAKAKGRIRVVDGDDFVVTVPKERRKSGGTAPAPAR